MTSISYSQKQWELIPNEKFEKVIFVTCENDTTGVKILLKDKIVEAKKISKVIKRVGDNYNGNLYYKTLHYSVDNKLVSVNDVLFEEKNSPHVLNSDIIYWNQDTVPLNTLDSRGYTTEN